MPLLHQPLGLRVPSEQSAISKVPYAAAFHALGFTEAAAFDAEDDDDDMPLAAFMAHSSGLLPQPDTFDLEEKPRKKRRRSSAKGAQKQQQKAEHPAWFAPCGRSAWAPALALDTPALAAALRSAPFLKRVFLSSATLIVVPSMLIRHWQEQVGPPSPTSSMDEASCFQPPTKKFLLQAPTAFTPHPSPPPGDIPRGLIGTLRRPLSALYLLHCDSLSLPSCALLLLPNRSSRTWRWAAFEWPSTARAIQTQVAPAAPSSCLSFFDIFFLP